MINAKEAREATNAARERNATNVKDKLKAAIDKATEAGALSCGVVGLTSMETNMALEILKAGGYQAHAAEDMRDHDWSIKIIW